MSNNFKQFINDTAWSFLSLFVSSSIFFILRIFLARYYGAGDLGLYTLAFTAYSFGLVLSGFGIGAGITKYVAEKRYDSTYINLLTTGGIISSLTTGCCAGLILYVASPYISDLFFRMPELTVLFRIVSFSFPFIALEKSILGLLNGIRRMKLYTLINIAQNVLVIILSITFALYGFDINYAVLSFVLPTIIMSVISLYWTRRYLIFPNLKKYSPTIKLLLSFGLYVSLSTSLGFIQTYTNTTLLGYYLTDINVGQFGVATTMIQIIWLPSQAVQMITTPLIAGYWGKNEIENIEYLINRCMKWTVIYALLAAFILGFLSQDILRLLFGEEFLVSAPLLQIMLCGGILNAMLSSVGGALASTAFIKLIFLLTGITVILNIILNIFLIKILGMTGAALATSMSMIISSLIHFFFIQRLIKIKIDWIWFIKIIGSALILGLCTYFLSVIVNLYIVVTIAFLVLFFVILKSFLGREERAILKKTLLPLLFK